MTAVSDLLDKVERLYGIRFNEVDTGGGCCALEARLESGHWIIATDDGLCSIKERYEWELARQCPAGWSVGIYAHVDGADWYHGEQAVVYLDEPDAVAEHLPEIVEQALERLASRD